MNDNNDQSVGEQTERLWRAFRRDLSGAILEWTGFEDGVAGKAIDRLAKTWERLCETNIDVAARILHGVEQIDLMMARNGKPNSPMDHRLRQMQEVVGVATIARDANPDAETETLGDLMRLGDEEIRRQVDEETDGDH